MSTIIVPLLVLAAFVAACVRLAMLKKRGPGWGKTQVARFWFHTASWLGLILIFATAYWLEVWQGKNLSVLVVVGVALVLFIGPQMIVNRIGRDVEIDN